MLFSTYGFGMIVLLASAASGSSLTAKINIDMQMFEEDLLKFCGNRKDGSYANSKNCREWIECTAGAGIVKPCNPGEMFYPATKKCVASTFTSCKQRDILCDKALGDKNWLYGRSVARELRSINATLTKPQSIDADTFVFSDATDRATLVASTAFTCQGIKKVSRSPVPGTCTNFNTCIKGKAFTGTCPTGFSFDAPSLMCVPTSQARCALAVACTTDGVAGVSGSCDRFTICCDELGEVVYCKSGFSFDTAASMCVPSGKATCA